MLPASLKDETTKMNSKINKHKVTVQMNHQTAYQKANASVFFFIHRTFFKNNFSQPHKWHIWFCPTHKPTLRKTKRAIF
jgi:hypothetical protein